MARRGLSFEDVRRLALALPGVSERTAYGRPAVYVGKKMLACLGREPDHFVLPMALDEREVRLAAEPDVYFLTDHYRGWPYVLVRFAAAREDAVAHLLERRWREIAPKPKRKDKASD